MSESPGGIDPLAETSGATTGDGPASGQRLGEFVLRERIGAGGQGEIYRAEQASLGRDAVIKLLRLPPGGDPELTARFMREAQLASRLDHPYAAHVYAFGSADDSLWIAMEYVRGMTLADSIERDGPMPLARFAPLFDRLCQVVQSAHDEGIVHRDIKPANVMMVTRAGRLLPKLLDLGIARLTSAPVIEDLSKLPEPGQTAIGPALNVTHSWNSHIGTPFYMAPEQWTDPRAVDARADVYALGVLAFEVLSGKPPFGGDSLLAIARAHARAAVPALDPALPAALAAVFARALAKKAADRYASSLELAAAFKAASGHSELDELPGLPAELREALVADAPQPIADAICALEAARSPAQLVAAAAAVARTCLVFIGGMALAARAVVGPGGARDEPDAAELLGQLRQHSLAPAAWLALARALTRPFVALRGAHPVPCLIDLLGRAEPDGDPFDQLVAIEQAVVTESADGTVEPDLAGLMARLARSLAALGPLYDLRLIVARGDHAELWQGAARRTHRVLPAMLGLPDGELGLLHGHGALALTLAPVCQLLRPTPGAPEEIFMVTGKGRFGARLVALPQSFERSDDDFWTWLQAVSPAATLSETETRDVESPYRGLAPFTTADAAQFVGREREVEALVNRLRRQGLIAVVGPSGAGKSSFVQAGVVPSLPPGWRVVVMRPGGAPLAALRARLATDGIELPEVEAGPALGAALRRAAAARGGTLMVIVDQFEELFTLTEDPAERDRFIESLVGALDADEADGPIRVMLTLRDDFLVRAQSLAALRDRLSRGLELLTTPQPADLLRILVEPASRAGYTFDDPTLPGRMVTAVENLPGALPLLSFTASRLWELRDRRLERLTAAAYEALGGVGGALGQHAETTSESLPAAQRPLVRELFRHLVTSAGTRAIISRSDLHQLIGDQLEPLLERLINARLLVGSEGADGTEQVEIIHEALLASWPRLVAWRTEDSEHARAREQLRASARQWKERGRPSGLLWRGDALAEHRAWRQRYDGRLTDLEDEFATASGRAERRVRRVRRAVAGVVIAASLVSTVVFAGLRGKAEQSADAARRRLVELYAEQGRQELLDGRSGRAAAFLSEAYRGDPASTSIRFLLAGALTGLGQIEARCPQHGKLQAVAMSPAGDRILTGSDDGTVRLWDRSCRPIGPGAQHGGAAWVTSFTTDGRLGAAGSRDGIVDLFDSGTGAVLHRLKHKGRVTSLALSPDGARVAAGTSEGAVRLSSTADGATLRELAPCKTSVVALGFSPDGKHLAASCIEGAVAIWDEQFTQLQRGPGHDGPVRTAVFDRAGAHLATGSDDGLAVIWDAATGARRAELIGHVGPIVSVAFHPDGSQLATGSDDHTARIWDLATRRPIASLEGHKGAVRFVGFAAGARRLVTASLDGSARVWDLASGSMRLSLDAHRGEIWTGAVAGGAGEHLVTAGYDGQAIVWRVDGGAEASQWPGPDHAAAALAMTRPELAIADGHDVLLASATGGAPRVVARHTATLRTLRLSPADDELTAVDDSGRIARWTLAGAPRGELTLPSAYRIAYRPGGDELAIVAEDGTVALWPRGATAPRCQVRHTAATWSVAWNPGATALAVVAEDSQALIVRPRDCAIVQRIALSAPGNVVVFRDDDTALVGLESGTIESWQLSTGRRLSSFDGVAEILLALAISPDRTRLASATVGGGLTIWDAATGVRLLTIVAHVGELRDLAFDATGEVLVTAGIGGTRTWRLPLERRSPAVIAEQVRCGLRWQIIAGAVVESDRTGCSGGPGPAGP